MLPVLVTISKSKVYYKECACAFPVNLWPNIVLESYVLEQSFKCVYKPYVRVEIYQIDSDKDY